MNDWAGINEALLQGSYSARALVPASPWLDAKPPVMPNVKIDWRKGEAAVRSKDKDLRYWTLSMWDGKKWLLKTVVSANTKTVPLPLEAHRIAVAAVDKVGNAGPAKVLVRPREP
jgi:hypothetical protein